MKLIHNQKNYPVKTIFTAKDLLEGATVQIKKINNSDETIGETYTCFIHAFNRKSITFEFLLAGKFHYLVYNWKDFQLVEK